MIQKPQSRVYVVDDDQGMRDSLLRLLRRLEYDCQAFASAEAFLLQFTSDTNGCLILDMRMPGMDGVALHERVLAINPKFPVIFLTGHATVPLAVDSMRRGAVHFLEKPIEPTALVDIIREALSLDQSHRNRTRERQELEERLGTLSPREREVLDLLLQGQRTAGIAQTLCIAPGTVKLHRAHIMKKMGISSAAELIRRMFEAQLAAPASDRVAPTEAQ
ncbi:MAG: response regulator transcription factor [Phycisphaeraceae bacterium]|nr:response regulator transcription factor [Phycisphaeraceae bacterium]